MYRTNVSELLRPQVYNTNNIHTNFVFLFRSGASSYKKSIGMMKLTSAMETSTRNLSRQTAYNDLTEESPTHSDCDDFSDTDSFIM